MFNYFCKIWIEPCISYPIQYCINALNYQSLFKFPSTNTTIVVEKNQIFPKPRNEEEALKFLQYLSNKTHQVYTGISFIFNGESLNFYEKTDVTFRNISLTDIKFYIKNHNPYDKSGGYGIQDYSSIFISKINGCFFNVVGFPLSKFYNKFRFFLKKIPENCLVKNSEKL